MVINTSPGAAYQPQERKFEGIPGLARTLSGTLFATWYSGGADEGPDNYVALITSADDGKSWSPILAVVDDPAGPSRAFDPVLWCDPAGRLWWFYAQSQGTWDGRGGVWAIVCESPDDPVLKWQDARWIADGVMMNKPTVLTDGSWLLPIAGWRHGRKNLTGPDIPPAGTLVYRSVDSGKTFTLRGTANVPCAHFDEHLIVQLKTGDLWMLVRAGTGISESVSNDGGKTWTEGVPSRIPHVSSRFFIRRLNSGNLVLVKHNPPMDSEWLRTDIIPSWRGRSHLTAYLSKDDGATWLGGLVLDDRLVVSYPDGDQGADGLIYIVHDYNRKTDREIVLSVISEADIEAGHVIGQGSRLRQVINKSTLACPSAPR